jgi:hypothetical protein
MDKDLEKQIAKDNPDEAKPAEPVKRPVMDVKPRGGQPVPATRSAEAKPPAESPATAPVEPPPEQPAEGDKSEAAQKPEPKKPKPAKQPGAPGVGLAITATVIIVLGIAALVVYAYLQSQ